MKKFVSGCMITKNEAEFLKQSIDSFIDYVDELIVIDDNSTDGTQDIVNSYTKAKLVTGTFNGDKFKQRNEYLKHANGEWVFCPDGDEVYFKKDMEKIRLAMEQDESLLWIRFQLINFWKDMNHIIVGHVWNQIMQRAFRNLSGVGYYDRHHSVSIKPGLLLSYMAKEQKRVSDFIIRVPHYSYCKNALMIKKKVGYYIRRDCDVSSEKEVWDLVYKHPYISEDYSHPRYGKNGLRCCGTYNYDDNHKIVDKVIPYKGNHPETIKSHPKFKFLTDYAAQMNRYMESHWQYHNHLHHIRHQKRIKHVADLCSGKTLEIGSANGFSTHTMAEHNKDVKFVGLEPTDWGFKRARIDYPDIEFYKAFGENTPFNDNSFDTVLLAEIIEHVDNPDDLLKEAWRICKHKLIITAPAHPSGATCDPDHKRYFDEQKMRNLINKYYDNCKIIFSGLDRRGLPAKQNRIWFGITEIYKGN